MKRYLYAQIFFFLSCLFYGYTAKPTIIYTQTKHTAITVIQLLFTVRFFPPKTYLAVCISVLQKHSTGRRSC